MKFMLFSLAVLFSLLAHNFAQAEIYKGEPYPSERKSYSLALKFTQLLKNDADYAEGMHLTQEELSDLSYYLHYYQFTYVEIFEAKRMFLEEFELSKAQSMEGEKFLKDFQWIKSRMDHYEFYEKLKCKFAYGESLYKGIRESVWENRGKYQFPNKETEEEFYARYENSKDKRQVAGHCYDQDKYRE